MLESDIKSKATKALNQAGWIVIHLIQTNLNGIPDTLILRDGRYLFIEFKQPGKHPTKLQDHRHAQIINRKGEVLIVREPNDYQQLL